MAKKLLKPKGARTKPAPTPQYSPLQVLLALASIGAAGAAVWAAASSGSGGSGAAARAAAGKARRIRARDAHLECGGEFVRQASGHVAAGRFEQAFYALGNASAAEDFGRCPGRGPVELNLGRLLAFNLPEAMRDGARAAAHLVAAAKLMPESAQPPYALAELAVQRGYDEEAFGAARLQLQRALRIASEEQPDAVLLARVADLLSEVLMGTLLAKRLATAEADVRGARKAWEEALALSRFVSTTKIAQDTAKWEQLAASGRSAGGERCKAARIKTWDAERWPSRRPCARLQRTKGQSLSDLLGRFNRSEPVVIGGWWPEFPSRAAFAGALAEEVAAQRVVEIGVPFADGALIQVQKSAAWLGSSSVARALKAGERSSGRQEENLVVRGSQSFITLKDFVALSQGVGQLNTALYLFAGNTDVYMPGFRKLITAPRTLAPARGPPSGPLAEVNMWLGVGGTVSGLHADQMHNLHHLIDGEAKEFLLFPPHQAGKLSQEPMVEVKSRTDAGGHNAKAGTAPASEAEGVRVENFASADCEHPDDTFLQATAMKCTVNVGETIFLPSGWFHNVLTRSGAGCLSAGVNLWYRESE